MFNNTAGFTDRILSLKSFISVFIFKCQVGGGTLQQLFHAFISVQAPENRNGCGFITLE